MKICLNCSGSFPSTIVLAGKKRNLANRKYCFTCSPFGEHNTSRLDRKDGIEANCTRCHKPFAYSRDKGHRRTVCNSCLVNNRRPKRKAFAVEYKGGKCLMCSYSKCIEALDFHHLDPRAKRDDIAKLYLAKLEVLEAELDKCVLLCCRCHTEFHAGMISHEELVSRESARVAATSSLGDANVSMPG
jgi:hypothetical protein